jgi:hypothetical protein
MVTFLIKKYMYPAVFAIQFVIIVTILLVIEDVKNNNSFLLQQLKQLEATNHSKDEIIQQFEQSISYNESHNTSILYTDYGFTKRLVDEEIEINPSPTKNLYV